jgi:hypothetical protein
MSGMFSIYLQTQVREIQSIEQNEDETARSAGSVAAVAQMFTDVFFQPL